MGYYTSEPEAAPRVISCASPKTHTPASPVKERGHRFYSPGLGRWSSRDPIGEKGGKNQYGFVRNRTLDYRDPIGLIGQCCCCSAVSIAAEYDSPVTENVERKDGWWDGFYQKLRFPITVRYPYHPTIRGDCSYEWSEWSDRQTSTHTGGSGWENFGQPSGPPTEEWRTKRKRLCFGVDKIKFNDTPSYYWRQNEAPAPGWTWKHIIKIVVKSTPGCPGPAQVGVELERNCTWLGEEDAQCTVQVRNL